MKLMSVIIVALVGVSANVTAEINPSNVKSSIADSPPPKMRVIDRDWSYFKSIPCDKISTITFHSRSEEIFLAKRKRQCIDKYKAFLPKPVNR